MGRLGIKSKLYRNTAGYGGPTWSEVTLISDLSVNPSWEKGPADTRGSRVKKSVKTMLGLTFTGNMKKSPGDANYEAFMDALVSDNVVDLLVLDGAKDEDGSRGWRVECQIFEGTEDQAMSVGAIYEALSIEPTDTDHEPQAVYVSGSALTYSTPGEDGDDFS